MVRRIELTPETWHALDELQYAIGRPLHELAEEAFADLLKKRRQPRSLKEALLKVTQRQHAPLGR
jgi:predicted transcriptional regulator